MPEEATNFEDIRTDIFLLLVLALCRPALACGPAGWAFFAPLVLTLSVPSSVLTGLIGLPLLYLQGRRPRLGGVLLAQVLGCLAGFPITVMIFSAGGGIEHWVLALSTGCAGVTSAVMWFTSRPAGSGSTEDPLPPPAPAADPGQEWKLVR